MYTFLLTYTFGLWDLFCIFEGFILNISSFFGKGTIDSRILGETPPHYNLSVVNSSSLALGWKWKSIAKY